LTKCPSLWYLNVRMKKKEAKWIALIFFLFFFSVIGCVGLKASPFKVGEKLTYRVKLFGIPVGEKTLEVKDIVQIDGRSTYFLYSKVKTSGLADLFFPLDDEMKSFADVDTLYPCQINIHFQQGDLPAKDLVIQIDQKAGVARIEDRGKKQEWEKELSGPTLDTISLIYWLRTQDLQVGKMFSLFLLEDSSLRDLKIEVVKKERINVAKENYSTFLCSEVGSNKIKVWFSEDKSHLPVRIEVATDVGVLSAYLIKIE